MVGRALPMLALLCAGCLSWHQGPMPGEPRDATFASVTQDGQPLRIRYRDEGPQAAQTVVLLHGFASALETWATVTPRLIKTHRVVSLDLKGFGWTDRPQGDYSPVAQARLVLALLDARGVDRFSIVGHSWGSSVALAVALEAPDRVQRVALYDAWVFEDQLPAFFRWSRVQGVGEALFGLFYKERADERLVRAFYNPKVVREEFVDEVERALERPGTVAAALAAARGQRFAELQVRWAQVKQPTLLLWGQQDAVSWLEFGERLAATLPDARLRVYPRCGHFPMIEAAEASYAALSAFLRGEAVP